MPPKVKVTKDMILDASFQIIRKEGYESLNARRIAGFLECSTQPILYHFNTMDEIRAEVYQIADNYHTDYIMPKGDSDKNPMLELGLNYIRFGHEESNLFRFLFQTNEFGGMEVNALLNAPELAAIIGIVAMSVQCSEQDAKDIFLAFFIAAHGCASLMANNSMDYDEAQFETVLKRVYNGMLAVKKGR